MKTIQSALISVFYKDGLGPIIEKLNALGVKLYSTGGTQTFIESMQVEVTPVESVTGYPSILGGRVKTLHPGVFGGILYRRDNPQDIEEIAKFNIPSIDLVIVDLYPFEETVKNGGTDAEIIEKIDIGGVSLIRAAAKNHADSVIVSNKSQYAKLLELLENQNGALNDSDRRWFAMEAFKTTSEYETAIHNYFAGNKITPLRYGENPHQDASFVGDLDALFTKHQGKELSYNNLLDVDAAFNLVNDFPKDRAVFAIIKHNNACGIAIRSSVKEAYDTALACDPVSAFGGILCSNQPIDTATALEADKLFFEVMLAPGYEDGALEILTSKKNRILLSYNPIQAQGKMLRSCLNGLLVQDRDTLVETADNLKPVTNLQPTQNQIEDLLFANTICKHTKSNTIVLTKNLQLLASGTGQTSRVDALQQAIAKANHFGFDLKDAVMASDAFFPFPDCVEIAGNAGITAVIQPGGSIKDQLSIDYCNAHQIAMVTTGNRHFKH
jgi:phosphoribosylaminoimidazolecarboxamide formyltransferase/IMP cyclohydrolase